MSLESADPAMAEYSGILGLDVISQFDLEYNEAARRFRMYAPIVGAKSGRPPPWLPDGLTPADCIRADTVGARMLVSFDSSDGPHPSWADTLRRLNQLRRSGDLQTLQERDFKVPVVVNGHLIWGPFDSGSNITMMNWAAAHAIGLVPHVAVEGDTSGLACYRATTFAKCYEAKWGAYNPTPGAMWAEDSAKLQVSGRRLADVPISVFENWPFPTDFFGPHAAPHFALGVDAFRDRVLFLSYSTGMVCVGEPRGGKGSGWQ
jgi:hypothetical protein